jgi:prepilin-type N-terminal cleavage/methylation domain-containing protein
MNPGLPAKQKGFTLIELMIGLVVGLIVLSGVLYTFVSTVKSSRDILFSARLNQDMAAITSIIVDDMRRAGHLIHDSGSSFYDTMGEDIFVVSPSCVLYSYDEDGNGLIEAGNNEFKGVRLQNSALELKTSGNDMDNCNTGNWSQISDENFMTITSAIFDDTSVCADNASNPASAAVAACAGLGTDDVAAVREITITISAQVNSDTDWQKTVQESVKIRNDFYAH